MSFTLPKYTRQALLGVVMFACWQSELAMKLIVILLILRVELLDLYELPAIRQVINTFKDYMGAVNHLSACVDKLLPFMENKAKVNKNQPPVVHFCTPDPSCGLDPTAK